MDKSSVERPGSDFDGESPGVTVFSHSEFLDGVMGDEEAARMLINIFLKDMPGQIAALRKFLNSGDRERAGAQAHKIKGASGNVGGFALCRVADALEKSIGDDDPKKTVKLLPRIDKEFIRLKKAMGPYR